MEIDYSKLSRDYRLEPIKRGEYICKKDLIYLYIECNLNFKQIGECCGKPWQWASKMKSFYKLEKSKEMKAESQRQYYLQTLGVKNPAQLKTSQEKKKQTMLERYGVDNANKCPEIREKGTQTCLKKYGVENPAQLKQIQDKMKKTMYKHFGVEHSSKAEEVKAKKQKTMQERYGCAAPMQNPELKKKIQQTNLERYGTKNPFQAKKCQEKQKQTLEQRYGVKNSFQIPEAKEKHKQTCLKKYGTTNPNKCPEIREKGTQTCLKKYGVENPSQVEEIKEKRKQTFLAHFGVDNPNKCPENIQKIYKTKRERGTFNSSKDEIKLLQLLQKKFAIVEYQYNLDSRYPYACDFYIPELDLFIEYQGFMTHGNEPYNPNSKEHQKIIEKWKQKANELNVEGKYKDLYANAIETWTKSDPKKREIAKRNNLNWLEFFTIQKFMEWYNSIGE